MVHAPVRSQVQHGKFTDDELVLNLDQWFPLLVILIVQFLAL